MKKLFISILFALLICFQVFAASQNTSSTTAATIITQVRYILNDDATNKFLDDTELLRWINDGLEDIANKTHCLETTENISLVGDTIEYAIVSTTYIDIKAVHYVDSDSKSTALRHGTPTMVGRTSQDYESSPEPGFWYDWNNKIGIYPSMTPVTSEFVTLYLTEQPAAIASGGTVPTPKIFDNALRAFVMSRAYQKDRQYAKAAQWFTVYNSELNLYRQDLIEQPKENE